MIWIVGNKGMLGQDLQATLLAAGLECQGTDREVDFTDPQALDSWYQSKLVRNGKKLDWIINCAAYTAVDKAEEERELCERLNVQGPARLAELAERVGAGLLHISTDYVFDGQGIIGTSGGRRSYIETDPVNPQGIYAKTKADGEAVIQATVAKHVILRTAWLYGLHGPNFVYTMLKLMRNRDSLGVVSDQWGSPTWTRDLAQVVLAVVKADNPETGIFHVSGEGITNWHGFALAIKSAGLAARLLDRDLTVNPLTTDQYPTKARRPAWSVLSKEKIKASYQVVIPEWEKSLAAFIAEVAKRRGDPAFSRFWIA